MGAPLFYTYFRINIYFIYNFIRQVFWCHPRNLWYVKNTSAVYKVMDILDGRGPVMITPPTYLNYQGKVINFSLRRPIFITEHQAKVARIFEKGI